MPGATVQSANHTTTAVARVLFLRVVQGLPVCVAKVVPARARYSVRTTGMCEDGPMDAEGIYSGINSAANQPHERVLYGNLSQVVADGVIAAYGYVAHTIRERGCSVEAA